MPIFVAESLDHFKRGIKSSEALNLGIWNQVEFVEFIMISTQTSDISELMSKEEILKEAKPGTSLPKAINKKLRHFEKKHTWVGWSDRKKKMERIRADNVLVLFYDSNQNMLPDEMQEQLMQEVENAS